MTSPALVSARATADAFPLPVWTTTPDTAVTSVNPAWSTYTGLDAEASLDNGWLIAVHPDDRAVLLAPHSPTDEHGIPAAIEIRLRRADGAWRWHLARVAPIRDPDGALTGWVGTATDIDERWRAEAELRASEAHARAAIEHAGDLVYTLDLDGTLSAINPAIEHVLGYRPDEVIGRSVDTIIAPENLAYQAEVLKRKLAGEELSTYDVDLIARDGRRVTVEVNSRFAFADGQPVAIHGVARDVSASRAIQAERRAIEEQRQAFLEAVSHDLRNPLFMLRGQAQLARQRLRRGTNLDPTAIDASFASIEAASQLMDRQLDELQDVVRLQAGQPLELQTQSTDLLTLVTAAITEAQAASPRHQITHESSESDLIGVWDSLRLRRVIDNLLNNAVKYSPDGGAITVAVARETHPDSDWAVLTVRDQGVGIPVADLPHVFERYHRGSNVGWRTRGTGIGLSGVRQIVQQHGGTVSVESTEGHGSTFTVRLPLQVT